VANVAVDTMSVLETVNEAVGIGTGESDYRCDECGHEFAHGDGPDSYWFSCPECGNETGSEFTSLS